MKFLLELIFFNLSSLNYDRNPFFTLKRHNYNKDSKNFIIKRVIYFIILPVFIFMRNKFTILLISMLLLINSFLDAQCFKKISTIWETNIALNIDGTIENYHNQSKAPC
ncbi:MAG: hypothetical protein K0R36_2492 [Chryseobacterium sp.]|jgi:hypothetical protein|nr:hypothetical protein [Chryseobacterium sp.]